MNKHTPAPWIYSHRQIPHDKNGMYATQVYTEDGETIATLSWYPTPKDADGSISTYRAANARLIAAAPELLEALELCSNSLATYGSHPIIEKIVNNAINKATKP